MYRQKLFLSVCVSCLIGSLSIVHFSTFAYAQQQVVAQDVDAPQEKTTEDRLFEAKQSADYEAQNEVSENNDIDLDEENIATITAEGDFVVPTYLLPTTENDDTDIKKKNSKTLTSTHTKTHLPIVQIKQTELIPVKEQLEVERRLTGSDKQTLDLYKNATGQSKNIVASKNQNTVAPKLQHEPVQQIAQTAETREQPVYQNIQTDEISDILGSSSGSQSDMNEKKDKKTLLLPLKPIKKAKRPVQNDDVLPPPIMKTFSSEFADKVLMAAKINQTLPLIMPMDLKVSFYPNATEFSGQSIKWIKAFSYKALQDPRYIVQVRLSNVNLPLQQKRLYLIERIFESTGLSTHQLQVDFVPRPQDTLVLRMVRNVKDLAVKPDKKQNALIHW